MTLGIGVERSLKLSEPDPVWAARPLIQLISPGMWPPGRGPFVQHWGLMTAPI